MRSNGRRIHPQKCSDGLAIHIRVAAKAKTSDSHISATPAAIQCQIVLAAWTSTSPNGDDRPGNQMPQRSDGTGNAGRDPRAPNG